MTGNIIMSGPALNIAAGGTATGPVAIRQRPLSWVRLPSDWPPSTPLIVQGAVAEAEPPTGSTEWCDVVDRTGAAITLTGAPGQIILMEPGLVMGLRWLRFRVAAALSGARTLDWGGWYIG